MDFRKVKIGDVLPAPSARGIWGAECEPAWFIFTVPPRGELPASAWLTRNGVSECWHPTEAAFKRDRFKPGKRIPYQRPVAPGYLFAVLSSRPNWDVLFARSRGKLLKVVSHNGQPVPIPEDVIADMAQVPQRLEAIREAERERRMIRPGDKAKIKLGETEWTVTVDAIHEGIASFILPLLGGRPVSAPATAMQKVFRPEGADKA